MHGARNEFIYRCTHPLMIERDNSNAIAVSPEELQSQGESEWIKDVGSDHLDGNAAGGQPV